MKGPFLRILRVVEQRLKQCLEWLDSKHKECARQEAVNSIWKFAVSDCGCKKNWDDAHQLHNIKIGQYAI